MLRNMVTANWLCLGGAAALALTFTTADARANDGAATATTGGTAAEAASHGLEWSDKATSAQDGAMGAVFSSREELVNILIDRWAGQLPKSGPGSSVADLGKALENLPMVRLEHASTATDRGTFLRRLLGPVAAGAASIGSTQKASVAKTSVGVGTDHMVFVPVQPCRIFDTRNDTRGSMSAGETRSFYTNYPSGLSSFDDQGGNASHCPDVPFDPAAVQVTLTVINPTNNGFATLFPYSTSRPQASTINYSTGQIVANSTVVGTCISCGPDVNVYAHRAMDVLADITGYFVEKSKVIDLRPYNGILGQSASAGTGDSQGIVMPDSAISSYQVIAQLPDDYSSGTNMTLRETFTASCASQGVRWRVNSPSPRGWHVGSTVIDINGGTDVTLSTPSTAGQVFSRTVSYVPASNLSPGDSVSVSNFRAGSDANDTCSGTVILRSASLIYD